ncbi:hypothetical protein TeGR_g5795, partial [Tetraparma gracilis]
MDCTLMSHRLRSFTAAVALLSRCGRDLVLSSSASALTLSTVSPSNTAFLKVTFTRGFFHEFGPAHAKPRAGGGGEEGGEAPTFVCRCSLRACHSILRTARSGVHSLRLHSEGGGGGGTDSGTDDDAGAGEAGPRVGERRELTFEYNCLEKIQVVHRLAVSDLSAATYVPIDFGAGSGLACRVGDLASLTSHFGERGDVCMSFDAEAVTVSSVAKSAADDAAGVSTKASLAVGEFESYEFRTDRGDESGDEEDGPPGDVNEKAELVFSLRELK